MTLILRRGWLIISNLFKIRVKQNIKKTDGEVYLKVDRILSFLSFWIDHDP